MVIEFNQNQLDAFADDGEESLALLNWNRLKNQFPELSKKYFNDDEKKGVKFLTIAQTKVKKYLKGVEEHQDYNKWRMAYGELCFVVNQNDIDEDPYNKSLLEERLWPPFMAIDILAGILESSLLYPDSQKFYAELEGKKWD